MKIDFEPAEFADVIQRAVDAAFERLHSERPRDEAGRILLKKSEAAEALGVSPSTIDRLRREGGLPAVKLDGLVLFRPEALKGWAAAREVTT